MFHITSQTEKLLGFLRLERFKMVNEYGDSHLQRQLKLKLSNSRITKLWDDDIRKFRLPFRNAQFYVYREVFCYIVENRLFFSFFVCLYLHNCPNTSSNCCNHNEQTSRTVQSAKLAAQPVPTMLCNQNWQ
jgi:hypothetical protein